MLTATVLVGGLATVMFLPMLQQPRQVRPTGNTSDPRQTLAAMAHSSRFVEFYPQAATEAQRQAEASPASLSGRTILTSAPASAQQENRSPEVGVAGTGFRPEPSTFPPAFGGQPLPPFGNGPAFGTPLQDTAAESFANYDADAAAETDDSSAADSPQLRVPIQTETTQAIANTEEVAPAPFPVIEQSQTPSAVDATTVARTRSQIAAPAVQQPFKTSQQGYPAAAVSQNAVDGAPMQPRHLPPGSVYAPVTVNVDAGQMTDQFLRMEARIAELLAAQTGQQQPSKETVRRRNSRAERQQVNRHVQVQQEAAESIRAMEREMKQLMAEFRTLKSETDARLQELSSAADRANVAQQLMESYKRALEQEQRLRVARSAWTQESRTPQQSAAPTTKTLPEPAAAKVPVQLPPPRANSSPAPTAGSQMVEVAVPARSISQTTVPDAHSDSIPLRPMNSNTDTIDIPFPPAEPVVEPPVPALPQFQGDSKATDSSNHDERPSTQFSTFPVDGVATDRPVELPIADANSEEASFQTESRSPTQVLPAPKTAKAKSNVQAVSSTKPAASSQQRSSEQTTSKSSVAANPVPPATMVDGPSKVGFEHVYRFKMEGAEVAPAKEIAGTGKVCPDCGRVHGANVRHATRSTAPTATDDRATRAVRPASHQSQQATASTQTAKKQNSSRPVRPGSAPRVTQSRPQMSITAGSRLRPSDDDEFSDGTTTAMDRSSNRTAARGTNRHVLKSAGEVKPEENSAARPTIMHRVSATLRMLSNRVIE
ncbi:MAG: hypothetical protein Fues2KO_18390 [Fuerstiella sp.]